MVTQYGSYVKIEFATAMDGTGGGAGGSSNTRRFSSLLNMIVTSDDVRKRNRQRVLATIRRGGAMSRTDIGRVTGLSAATVSAIASDLIDEGVLVVPPNGESPITRRGRPKVALTLNPDAALVCALMLHLNSVSAAMIDFAGNTVGEHALELNTSLASTEALKKAMVGCIRQALKMCGRSGKRLKRIAVGVQGVTDVDGTEMLWSPVTKVGRLPIMSWLEGVFDVSVRVSNDCDMMAYALNWLEPQRFGENFAAVLLSHGVGMGLSLRGEVMNGTRSSGIEFGHMTHLPGGALCRCGNRGCIEAYAGDYAIARRANGESNGSAPSDLHDGPDMAAIAQSARNGDPDALAGIESAGEALGHGLASMFALVDPFPVALVGHGTAAFNLMEEPIRKALHTTIAGKDAADIAIFCYPDERPLVRQGSAISALLVLDGEIADAPHELAGV